MKSILLCLISIYWKLIPSDMRRKCIFRQSCSITIYNAVKSDGWAAGLGVAFLRFKQCRGGYRIYTSIDGKGFKMRLVDGSEIGQDEISSIILKPYIQGIKEFDSNISMKR